MVREAKGIDMWAWMNQFGTPKMRRRDLHFLFHGPQPTKRFLFSRVGQCCDVPALFPGLLTGLPRMTCAAQQGQVTASSGLVPKEVPVAILSCVRSIPLGPMSTPVLGWVICVFM